MTRLWHAVWSSLYSTVLASMSWTWLASMQMHAHTLFSHWYVPSQSLILLFHTSRFAKEYSTSPGRGYGSGVIQVLKKLASPQLSDVYQPARDQFNGRGSFGNGGAMRAAPFALAFPSLADVKRVSQVRAQLFWQYQQSLCQRSWRFYHLGLIDALFSCSLPAWVPR